MGQKYNCSTFMCVYQNVRVSVSQNFYYMYDNWEQKKIFFFIYFLVKNYVAARSGSMCSLIGFWLVNEKTAVENIIYAVNHKKPLRFYSKIL